MNVLVWTPFTRLNNRSLFAGTLALLGLGCLIPVQGAVTPGIDAQLAWAANPEADVTGYRLYLGTSSGAYTSTFDAGDTPSLTLEGLEEGVTYYAAVTAYNLAGLESNYSGELVFSISPSSLAVSSLTRTADGTLTFQLAGGSGSPIQVSVYASSNLTDWTLLETVPDVLGAFTLVDPQAATEPKRFYRLDTTE